MPEKDAAHRWVARSWGSVHPWASGRVFQNFADPELDAKMQEVWTEFLQH